MRGVDLDALDVEQIDARAVREVVLVPTLREVRVAERLELRPAERRVEIAVRVGDLADVDDRDARDAVACGRARRRSRTSSHVT